MTCCQESTDMRLELLSFINLMLILVIIQFFQSEVRLNNYFKHSL